MLIKLCSAMENPLYFLVQSTRERRAFLWSWEDEFMPRCLGKLENGALQFIRTFQKRSGKHSIIPLRLVCQGTALLHTLLFVPKADFSLTVGASGARRPSLKCPLCQVNPVSFDGIVASSRHLFVFAVVPFPSRFQDFSAIKCTQIWVFWLSRCISMGKEMIVSGVYRSIYDFVLHQARFLR